MTNEKGRRLNSQNEINRSLLHHKLIKEFSSQTPINPFSLSTVETLANLILLKLRGSHSRLTSDSLQVLPETLLPHVSESENPSQQVFGLWRTPCKWGGTLDSNILLVLNNEKYSTLTHEFLGSFRASLILRN